MSLSRVPNPNPSVPLENAAPREPELPFGKQTGNHRVTWDGRNFKEFQGISIPPSATFHHPRLLQPCLGHSQGSRGFSGNSTFPGRNPFPVSRFFGMIWAVWGVCRTQVELGAVPVALTRHRALVDVSGPLVPVGFVRSSHHQPAENTEPSAPGEREFPGKKDPSGVPSREHSKPTWEPREERRSSSRMAPNSSGSA